MNHERRLLASSRVALAALGHDFGKFAERAAIDVESETLATHLQLYCPRQEAGGRVWHTHKHAAYTALAFDIIERHAPDLVGDDLFPFADWRSREADDSLLNAAARHHLPGSFLQWIVATADRVASGFERERFDAYNRAEEGTETGKNHYQARQLTLFEPIRLDGDQVRVTPAGLKYRYPQLPLSPTSIFPQPREAVEPDNDADAQRQYRGLWNGFLEALERIPTSHRRALPLWLDHFDTLWQTYTHAIPSATAFGTRPDVSLYDHSKATAALATALWRYHHDRGDDSQEAAEAMRTRADWDDDKLLLIQGDFFGIQAFIFAHGGDSSKKAAKLLRGRSFYVSLITECAALALLDALALPSTSQIINAAGKFLIVAPNTDEAVAVVERVRQRFDAWFLEHSWGRSGIGIARQSAACNDFVAARKNDRFKQLMTRLHRQLERSKFSHFDLCGENPPAPVFGGYLDGFRGRVCAVDDKAPAEGAGDLSRLARDQIDIGDWLVKQDRLVISRTPLQESRTLRIPLFGYHIHFTGGEEKSGRFGAEAANGNIRRLFDFSPPAADGGAPLWNGYARRNIAGYVPLFGELDDWNAERYQTLKAEALEYDQEPGSLKTLNHLACEDKRLDKDGRWMGIEALSTLKGDIDDLGAIFQQGLEQPTFAKMAALSRQVNNFFAVYLPWLCRAEFPDSYTVFAGGDDFFLIGPWKSQIELVRRLRSEFRGYVAENEQLHFSAGLSTTKPGLPIEQMAALGEEALEQAKAHASPDQPDDRKNAVTCFGRSLKWDDFDRLWDDALARLAAHGEAYDLSTGYVYGLLRLTDMAADASKPENALWRSQLCYRTQRMVLNDRSLDSERSERALTELVIDIGKLGIERYRAAYKIALHAFLYQHRD